MLWEREAAGLGLLGAASSESCRGERSAPGLRLLRLESAAASAVALTCGLCVLVGLDGCEVRLCDPCARLCPCVLCVPCVSCVSRLPRVSFYR